MCIYFNIRIKIPSIVHDETRIILRLHYPIVSGAVENINVAFYINSYIMRDKLFHIKT